MFPEVAAWVKRETSDWVVTHGGMAYSFRLRAGGYLIYCVKVLALFLFTNVM